MKKKKTLKRIALALLLIFIGIQVIRPAKNTGNAEATTDIMHVVTVPDTVKSMLKESCYDCHSNNTRYPWYAEVSPMSWLLASHVKNGKAQLNFSEFAQLSPRRQRSKLNSVAKQTENRQMPLKSYLILHSKAKLTDGQVQLIKNWTDSARAELDRKPS